MASSLSLTSIAFFGTIEFDGVAIVDDKSSVTGSVFEAFGK